MKRYRLVTRTTTASGSETHVSSVVTNAVEAVEGLTIERQLADATGWETTALVTDSLPELVCRRGRTTRHLTIRETGPFDDTL